MSSEPAGQTAPDNRKPKGPLTVALNLDHRKVFGIPGTNFFLNYDNPVGVLPSNLSPQQKNMVRIALTRGELVRGDKPVLTDRRDVSAAEPYLQLIRTKVNSALLLTHLKSLVGGTDDIGGYTRYQVIEWMQEMEVTNHGRPDILDMLQKAKEAIPGPTRPVDVHETRGPSGLPQSVATRSQGARSGSGSGRTALAREPDAGDLNEI